MDEDDLLYDLARAYESMLEDDPADWMEDDSRQVCGVIFAE